VSAVVERGLESHARGGVPESAVMGRCEMPYSGLLASRRARERRDRPWWDLASRLLPGHAGLPRQPFF